MSQGCPQCGDTRARLLRQEIQYRNARGRKLIAPRYLFVEIVALVALLAVLGIWLLPAFQVYFLESAVAVLLSPLLLIPRYRQAKRTLTYRVQCPTCKHRWMVFDRQNIG